MLITFSIPVIIILDIFGWFVIHMGMAYLFTRLPEHFINPGNWLFRSRTWERAGAFYDHALNIKRWKGYLPDGAALFAGGFQKKHLADTGVAYFQRFIVETCRGEACMELRVGKRGDDCVCPDGEFSVYSYAAV